MHNFSGKKDYVSVQQADGKRDHRQTRVLLLKIGEGHELFKEESSVEIGSLSLQSFDRHKSYLHLHLIRRYAFVSIMKILTFCSMGYQDLTHLNAFQVKKLLHRQYAVLTLASALTGFVISVE